MSLVPWRLSCRVVVFSSHRCPGELEHSNTGTAGRLAARSDANGALWRRAEAEVPQVRFARSTGARSPGAITPACLLHIQQRTATSVARSEQIDAAIDRHTFQSRHGNQKRSVFCTSCTSLGTRMPTTRTPGGCIETLFLRLCPRVPSNDPLDADQPIHLAKES